MFCIKGTFNVLEAVIAESGIERFVDLSTSEVFGRYAYRVTEVEVTSLGVVGEALATEHLCHVMHRQHGLPTVTIRPFNIFGPNQVGMGAIHRFTVRALRNETISVQILKSDESEVYAACLDLLERFDAVAPMAEVRADGWFDQVRLQISHVEDICQVMGEHLLAYAFILGIQIRSLMLDPHSPWNTAVHFPLNDDQVQTLSLGEFKLRVVQALLHDERIPISPRLPFDTETAVAVVVGRTLLLAPIYGLSLQSVFIGSLDEHQPRYLVSYLSDKGLEIEALDDFIELLRGKLRQEIAGMAEKPFTLDLFAVEKARQATASGDFEQVISVLESWPGLLRVGINPPLACDLSVHQERLAL